MQLVLAVFLVSLGCSLVALQIIRRIEGWVVGLDGVLTSNGLEHLGTPVHVPGTIMVVDPAAVAACCS
jgi:hypothetical protein